MYIDLYCKPTDSHNYLLYTCSSAHPHHCKKSIPHSQCLWIRRICGNLAHFDKHTLDFSSKFNDRIYPSQLVEESYIKARRIYRNNLLECTNHTEKTKSSKDNNILVTAFHLMTTVPQIILSNWNLLGKSYNTCFLHQKHDIEVYSRPQNLRDILVQVSTTTEPKQKYRIATSGPRAQMLIYPGPQLDQKSKTQHHITDLFKPQKMSK